jgi:hypothetical protein
MPPLRAFAALLLCLSACVDPVAQCADLDAAACPDGQVNGEDTTYCEDYYEGSCGSEWDAYVECAKQTPVCNDSETGVQQAYPCDAERSAHGRCLCEVESEYGWSPWCDLYGK